MTAVGVPIKILHEAEGHVVTIESSTGQVYRGKLVEAEDNMNCQLTNVVETHRDGHTTNLENVFIRGSEVRFLVLPDMLKNAPMFKNIGRAQSGARGMGMGDRRGAPRGRGRGGPPRGGFGRGGPRGGYRG